MISDSMQEEFAPYRGQAGVVARVVVELGRDIESLRGGWVLRNPRGRRCADDHRECRSMEGLFESLLAEAFS